jgi:hypothetical protein
VAWGYESAKHTYELFSGYRFFEDLQKWVCGNGSSIDPETELKQAVAVSWF